MKAILEYLDLKATTVNLESPADPSAYASLAEIADRLKQRYDSVDDSLGILLRNGWVKLYPSLKKHGRYVGSLRLPDITLEDAIQYASRFQIYPAAQWNVIYPSEMMTAITKPREALISLLGGKCAECEERDTEILQIDHVFNDGKSDRKRLGGRLFFYYLSNPEEAKSRLQVLCPNHHWKKSLQEFKGRIASTPKF